MPPLSAETLADARALRGVPFPQALALARRRRRRSFNVAYFDELSRALPDASAFSLGRFMACGAVAPPTPLLPVVQRTAPRTRGAGRPAGRRRAVRSRAGPSDESDEPPPARGRHDLAELRDLAASGLADADARSPGAPLWERVRNEADRRAEELRRRG